MALIKCPECGKEISDKSSICIHCGYPISEMKENSEELQEELLLKESKPLPENELLPEKQLKRDQNSSIKEEKKNVKIKPIYILGAVVAVIIIVVGTSQYNKIQKRNNELQAYNNAIYAYENENFQDAYEYFSNNEYKDSKEYLEKTVEKYTESLINDNSLEEADKYLALVNDEAVKKDLETKLTYAHGIDCFDKGLFSNAADIFRELKDYKDSEKYKNSAVIMNWMQGEWLLRYFADYDYHNRGAMKINGWNATTYIASGDRFEERASCILELNDDNTVSFKTSDIEYNMYYAEGKGYIGATLIKDSYYESLRDSYYPLTPWCYGKTTNDLAFVKPDKSEIVNGTAILPVPSEPKIGMTADEVKDSSWGEPDKINKTTYSWGTTEQWCYSNNRYIYLDGGYVTAISE